MFFEKLAFTVFSKFSDLFFDTKKHSFLNWRIDCVF